MTILEAAKLLLESGSGSKIVSQTGYGTVYACTSCGGTFGWTASRDGHKPNCKLEEARKIIKESK